jgi:aminoglycoside 6-adenylyltransferase
MDKAAAAYERLIEKFLDWARSDDNIRAAVVIGSRARTDHPADEWSDLDLLVVAEDTKLLLEGSDWIRVVGTPWITFVEQTPDGGFERRVLFKGGLDVDFAAEAAEDIRQMAGGPIPPFFADVIRRGVKVILDKDGMLEKIRTTTPESRAPSQAESEFLNLVNNFWYHTVWTGKHLRRGELWWAITCCNMHLKNLLRQMLEWNARATRGGVVDTWMRGRFLEEWADPKALAALPLVFTRYDEEDVWQALRATMELFHWLAVEAADSLKYPYPSSGEERARELVEGMVAGRRPDERPPSSCVSDYI